MVNSRRRPDIQLVLMRMVCVLLFLVLGTTSILSGQLAKYVTAGAGTDIARVSEFNITQTGTLTTGFNARIFREPGLDGEKTVQAPVTVTNSSEVAVKYTVTVSNPENNLPLSFSAKDSSGNEMISKELENGCTFTGYLAPNSDPETYTVTIRWKAGYTDESYSGKVDLIKITLTAVQAD